MRAIHIKNKFLLGMFSASLLLPLVHLHAALAASTSIHLSPATQTVTKGNTFTVVVGVTTSVDITGVDVNIAYPSSQMAFQDVSYSGSAFGTREAWAGGGGSIHIGRSASSTVTGELPLAVLTFKVIAEYGTGTVSVENTSTIENSGAPVSTTCGSATVDFGAVPKTSAQPSPTTTYTVLASPTKGRYDITPPVISNVQSKQTGANTVAITWTTNEPSTSQVEYGLDIHYGLNAPNSAMTTAHSVVLHSAFLQPDALFHYRVTSVDAGGNTVHSTDFVFTTKSVQYTLTVLDTDGKHIPRARVVLNGQTAYTKGDGKAVLTSSAGEQALTISYRDISLSKTVTIASDKVEQLDSVKLATHRALLDSRFIVYPALVLMGLFLGLASRAYLLKYPMMILRRNKKSRLLTMPISSMQLEYGDKNPAHNPYQIKRIFSFWGIWGSFVNVFHRPSKKVSKKIREEVKAAGLTKKPASTSKK